MILDDADEKYIPEPSKEEFESTQRMVLKQNATIDSEVNQVRVKVIVLTIIQTVDVTKVLYNNENHINALMKKKNDFRICIVAGCTFTFLVILLLAFLWTWSVSNYSSNASEQLGLIDKMRLENTKITQDSNELLLTTRKYFKDEKLTALELLENKKDLEMKFEVGRVTDKLF